MEEPSRGLTALLEPATSPFDAIRQTRPDGSEFWSGRDLMPLLGYGADWRNFAAATTRASATARNLGHDVSALFVAVTENSGGRPREDYCLTRFAAYLVAMNGDPRKPEVAAAQAYFAIRTREAETARPTMPTHSEALRGWAQELEAREALEERNVVLSGEVAQLTPKAEMFDGFLSTTGDYSVNEAAKCLARVGVMTGQNRLFQQMRDLGWVFRCASVWMPYQSQIDNGRLRSKARWYHHPTTGERVADSPQVRVTAKGLAALREALQDGAA